MEDKSGATLLWETSPLPLMQLWYKERIPLQKVTNVTKSDDATSTGVIFDVFLFLSLTVNENIKISTFVKLCPWQDISTVHDLLQLKLRRVLPS